MPNKNEVAAGMKRLGLSLVDVARFLEKSNTYVHRCLDPDDPKMLLKPDEIKRINSRYKIPLKHLR